LTAANLFPFQSIDRSSFNLDGNCGKKALKTCGEFDHLGEGRGIFSPSTEYLLPNTDGTLCWIGLAKPDHILKASDDHQE